jgi:hypothetical protein
LSLLKDFFKLNDTCQEITDESELVEHFGRSNDLRNVIYKPDTDQQIGYHALLLLESGLADGIDITVQGGEPSGRILRLTWEGHDFLEAAKEQSRWEDAKRLIFEKVGSASLQVWTAVLSQLTMKSLGL